MSKQSIPRLCFFFILFSSDRCAVLCRHMGNKHMAAAYCACQHCSRAFSTTYELQAHLHKHAIWRNKEFQCQNCSEGFSSRWVLCSLFQLEVDACLKVNLYRQCFDAWWSFYVFGINIDFHNSWLMFEDEGHVTYIGYLVILPCLC